MKEPILSGAKQGDKELFHSCKYDKSQVLLFKSTEKLFGFLLSTSKYLTASCIEWLQSAYCLDAKSDAPASELDDKITI